MITEFNRYTVSKTVIDLVKKVARDFPPKTKFTSLFGRTDTVSDKDEFYIDSDGQVFILGNKGEHLMIYDGKYWADIIPTTTH